MTKFYKDILRGLPTLDQAELQDVALKVSALRSMDATSVRAGPRGDTCWLLQGIVSVLRNLGLMQGETLIVDGKVKGQLVEAQGALLQAVGRELREAEKVALGRATAEAIADSIVSYKPVCARTMLQEVPRVLQALDHAYPGYLAGGMIGLILTRGIGSDR